jgi:hypothetical protein
MIMTAKHWPSHVTRALLSVTVTRWLAAELLALGCLSIGISIAWLWRAPGAPLGFLIALLGGVFTTYYLYKVLGASAGWGDTSLASTTAAIALAVVAAAASGEYWTRHHLPHDRFDMLVAPRISDPSAS